MSRRHGLGQGVLEGLADGGIIAPAKLFLEIHHVHPRKIRTIIAIGQAKEAIDAAVGLVHALHRRGGRAKHHQRPVVQSQPEGDLPGMIPGRLLGFIGMLLLLVHDDDARPFQGRKHRRTGADDHPRFSFADSAPLVVPLPHSQRAVEHRHVPAKMAHEPLDELGRQGNFRHQVQCGFARCQRAGDEMEIDRSLAAAGDAVEKRRAGLFLAGHGAEPFIGLFLGIVEHRHGRRLHIVRQGRLKHRAYRQRHHPRLKEAANGSHIGTGEVAQLLGAGTAQLGEKLQHRRLLGGAPALTFQVRLRLLLGHGQGGNLLGLVPKLLGKGHIGGKELPLT